MTTRDPDWDWLRVEWRDETRIVGLQPQIEYFTFERHALTVTVTDGRGGVATDTVVVDGNIESLFFVDVQSPRGGDSFASGADVPITWDAFNDFPFDHFRISVSSDNFATRRVLHNAVPSNEREFTWQNAGAAATAWRVRIDAFDESNRLLASDTSDAFTIRPPVAGALPWPWRDTPVGAEVPSGQASFSSGTFTMRGGGADVWGRADAFHFVYQPVDGDFTFTARVASVAGGEPWTKVGIMVRESLSANAAHHFLLATIGNGLAYQRRLVAGGASAHTSVGEGGAPVVFRFTRVAGILSMQMAPDLNTPFETVASVGMVGPVLIGMVTSSHTTSQLATATFDDVQVAGGLEQPLWTNLDVGAVGAPGSAREQSGRWTVTGSGADVWGTADAFHYVRRGVVGDFEFTARVAAVQNIHRWTKAGLMMREQIGASARHAFVLATPTTVKGVAFQRRTSESGETIGTAGPSIAPPMYLKLIRTGDIVSAYYRRSLSDTWTLLGQETYPDLRVVVDVGFAVSSHIDGRLAAATFDQISLSHFRPLRSQDIGDVGLPGSTTGDPLNVELRASGTDIWGTADAFRYASESITADATITARVSSIDGPHAWTKAGVMMRSAMNPPSAYAMVMVTPGKGIAFQARRVVGQRAVQIAVVPGVAPAWVRLTRSGDWSRATYTGSFSHDGITWTTLGSVDVQFNTNGFAGLALTSHDNSALATATFGNVSLVEHEP